MHIYSNCSELILNSDQIISYTVNETHDDSYIFIEAEDIRGENYILGKYSSEKIAVQVFQDFLFKLSHEGVFCFPVEDINE